MQEVTVKLNKWTPTGYGFAELGAEVLFVHISKMKVQTDKTALHAGMKLTGNIIDPAPGRPLRQLVNISVHPSSVNDPPPLPESKYVRPTPAPIVDAMIARETKVALVALGEVLPGEIIGGAK